MVTLEMNEAPTVSVIVDTYYRPQMLRHGIEALLAQTWPYVEIIIVDNGSTPESKEVIAEMVRRCPSIKVVVFEENQFSYEDLNKLIRTVWQAGLEASTGELVFHINDDDWVAEDFCERMARLFIENPACTTAIGLPVPVRPGGLEIDNRTNNLRPRYMPGHELALGWIEGKSVLSNPGFCFVVRRDALLEGGGFTVPIEYHQLFGIVAFGVTGFDPEARMYWRYHDHQANRLLLAWGLLILPYCHDLLEKFHLEERWTTAFGVRPARQVKNFMLKVAFAEAAQTFASNVAELRLTSALRVLQGVGGHLSFWKALPLEFWDQKRLLAANVVKALGLKPLFDRLRRHGGADGRYFDEKDSK